MLAITIRVRQFLGIKISTIMIHLDKSAVVVVALTVSVVLIASTASVVLIAFAALIVFVVAVDVANDAVVDAADGAAVNSSRFQAKTMIMKSPSRFIAGTFLDKIRHKKQVLVHRL